MSLSATSTYLLIISRKGSYIFPGQPVLMLDKLIVEEMFSNSQTTPPLVQLMAIPSPPIIFYLGEETRSS